MVERDFNEIFAENLKHLMYQRNFTQSELAKKLEVSVSTVNSWCHGVKTPRMDKIDAICKLFHVTRTDLMRDTRPPKKYSATPVKTTATEEATNSKEYSANRVGGVYEIIELTKKMTDEQLSEVIKFAQYILQR